MDSSLFVVRNGHSWEIELDSVENFTVCVISAKPAAYSETFIEQHLKRLPCRRVGLFGPARGPYRDLSDEAVPATLWSRRVLRRLMRMIGRQSIQQQVDAAVVDYLIQHNVDVILAEYGMTGADIASISRNAGVPLVVHFHGHDAYRDSVLEQYAGAYRELFAFAAGIVVVSRDMERQILSLGAPAGKVHRVCYGVDLAADAPTVARDRGIGRYLACGRFVEKKAPHLTILAFAQVAAVVGNATLTMVGDGPLLDACRQLAKALGIEERVVFRGRVGHDEVIREMARSSIFVQHSVVAVDNDHEGTPNTILEAAARGMAIVSTRHAGIPDVIEDGVSGLLVEEYDVAAMSRAMIRVGTDADLAKNLGAGARRRVAEYANLDKRIQELGEILRQAAGR